MIKFSDVVSDRAGNVVVGAIVTVTDYVSGVLIPLYEDDETTPVANPLSTDADGRIEFNLASGTYNFSFERNGIVFVRSKMSIGFGASGPGYLATSATSFAIAGSGSKAFTTQSGLAYRVGDHVKAYSTGSAAYMAGTVTSYVAGVLTFTVDEASGSGTHTDWTISLYSGTGGGGGSGTAGDLDYDTDGTLAANSDAKIATQKAVKTYVDLAVTGLWDWKGAQNCSGNPNYPAASKGDAYVVSVAGKIGGASGLTVAVGDLFVAAADNAGGTQAGVGSSWVIIEHNIPDLATVATTGDAADLTGTLSAARLVTSGVSAATYGDANNIPQVTVDNKGRVTSATNIPITVPSGVVEKIYLATYFT